MKKLLLLAWLPLLLCFTGQAQPRRDPRVQAATLDWLRARLGVREASGRNDGPAVAAIIKAGGGVPAQRPEWCGFTQAANQRAHGLPIPAAGMQGAARCWFTDATGKVLLPRTFYHVGRRGVLDSIQPGDLVGFAWRPSVIIHHVTRADERVAPLRKGRPPRGFYCLGGNEGRGAKAGLHRTFYFATAVTAAARWDYK
ncbi:hypothetical protein HHL22_20505 [Hymenobacter sp. RP-2-7]|uniref:Peptidoglycan endopeptidase n=1 Tax=Hymenobacter polaris TaxID=2682546 RepID=A0A7Y0FPP1_9BACT|nr:hypothetical protein [Hymenobacter polaris]NML67589.1 hypothetical protein [Hymenobacter polaris]